MPTALLFLSIRRINRDTRASDSRLEHDAHMRQRCDTLPVRCPDMTRRDPSAHSNSGRDMEES